MSDPVRQIEALDTAVFAVRSQTTANDRRSFLLLQKLVRDVLPSYVYLEVGSHVGGTLLPHLLDPKCRQAFSIDKRPPSQRDERGVMYDYKGNTTQRMLAMLAPHAPAENFRKLTTYDADLSDLPRGFTRADLLVIDAEHTNTAVFRDYLAALKSAGQSFIMAFHDANLTTDAEQMMEMHLADLGVPFRGFFLPDVVYALLTGDFIAKAGPALDAIALDREKFIAQSRIALMRIVAQHAGLIQGDKLGHL
jgi:hypothetical protein